MDYHPSNWSKCFDKNTGTFRYKHKGSGLIRDTFTTVGKVLTGAAKNVAKKNFRKGNKNNR